MFKPKLFVLLPSMRKEQLSGDIMSGILVGIVALPLAIAFGIASGVSPEKGLVTAVIGGFLVSLLGGSRVQIGGPTGAFIVIVYGIVQQYGLNGLMLATMMAGVILMIMGLAQFGSLIKFIPYPVIIGFTSGIAVIIFSSQVNDFLGLGITELPADFIPKWSIYLSHLGNIDPATLACGTAALAIILIWPRFSRKIPGSVIAILVTTTAVQLMGIETQTIESRFGSIPSTIPAPSVPAFDLETIRELIMPATTIAILAAIEALLSAVVADGMIGGRHKSNMELVAMGVANIASPLFGGIPVTGAIARTATNVKNGGRTPIAGIVHALTLLAIMLLFGGWAKYIPMATLSAILITVAWNMSEHHVFRRLLRGPGSDVAVLVTTFGLTVIFDLTIAIEIGLLLSVLIFMQRMSAVANIEVITRELKDRDDDYDDPGSMRTRILPEGVEIYEINGPFFFGAASKFKDSMHIVEKPPKVRILRMRNVPVIDATGLNTLRELVSDSRKKGIQLLFSGVAPEPLNAMNNYGIVEEVGRENIFSDIDSALEKARSLIA